MSHYTEFTGTADTTASSPSQSADNVAPIFDDSKEKAMSSSIPEGIPYAIPADPAKSGDDALDVDYEGYADKVNEPVAQDIARGYGPGESPDSLLVRAEKGEYTGSDKVEHPEGAPALVAKGQEFQTAKEKVDAADKGHGDEGADTAEDVKEAEDKGQVPADAPVSDGTGTDVDGGEVDTTETGQQGSGQFDPNEHTAAEVQEYLKTADDAEKDRVIAAEKDGQARKTVVGE